MSVKVLSEENVTQEAMEVLLAHLSPAKIARLWAAWQIGKGDYLAIRDRLCADETVETLYEKIQRYEDGEREPYVAR
jgi:hypothetical protein